MNLFTITDHDGALLGVYESESRPENIEPEITKVYDEWFRRYINDETDDRLESYFEKHLPDIGVYPIEIGNVTIIDR